VTTETAIGLMQLQVFMKGWQQPEPGRGKEIFSSRASRASNLRTVRELISIVLSQQVCGTWLQQP